MGRIGAAFLGITALLVGGVAALVVAGPGRDAVPRDTLLVGQLAEPKALDPATVTATNDFRIVKSLFEGLTRFRDGSLAVEPGLAESWDILDGGKTYLFRLKRGVSFHDGTPFDAEAVKFTFERMLDPKHPAAGGGPFPLAFFFSAVKAVEVVDPLTVRFRLDKPHAPLLANLAYPTGFIVSPKAVTADPKGFGRAPVGTGPFRFERWESNRQVALVRNEAFHGDKAKLARVVFRPIVDANARSSEMLAGGLDLLPELPADQLPGFRDPARFARHDRSGPHLWFLILNTREGPLKDSRVRQAVNYAIDKRPIVDDVLGRTATVPAGPISEAFGGASDPALQPYPHDPEKARALLKEAGAEGQEITFYAAEGGSGMLEPLAMAAAIQADLAKVGLKVRIETFEWNSYLARVNAGLGQADMAQMAWMTNDPDTLPSLTLASGATPDKGGFNAGGYSNPRLDDLLERARTETDQAAREKLYREADRLVHDDAPWALVASWRQTAVTTAEVEGLTLQPSFLLDLAGVSKR